MPKPIKRREPEVSELSHTLERDGWKLEIDICRGGDGKWVLSVFDERGMGTHWLEGFDSDQRALEEALRAIEQEGIGAFSESIPYLDH